MQLGPFIIMHKQDYPAWVKTHKLSRCLTENDVDDILSGRKHLHLNPSRKLRVIASDKCQIETERVE